MERKKFNALIYCIIMVPFVKLRMLQSDLHSLGES